MGAAAAPTGFWGGTGAAAIEGCRGTALVVAARAKGLRGAAAAGAAAPEGIRRGAAVAVDDTLEAFRDDAAAVTAEAFRGRTAEVAVGPGVFRDGSADAAAVAVEAFWGGGVEIVGLGFCGEGTETWLLGSEGLAEAAGGAGSGSAADELTAGNGEEGRTSSDARAVRSIGGSEF